MYAIVEVGGKQYQVKKGDIIETEKLPAHKTKEISLSKVLLLYKDKKLEVGRPLLKGVHVKAEVLAEVKARKAISFKYRRRKSSHWTKGHRQKLTRIRIKEIEATAS